MHPLHKFDNHCIASSGILLNFEYHSMYFFQSPVNCRKSFQIFILHLKKPQYQINQIFLNVEEYYLFQIIYIDFANSRPPTIIAPKFGGYFSNIQFEKFCKFLEKNNSV